MIDWTKPVQTRDGRKVRLIGTDFDRTDGQCMVIELGDGIQGHRLPDGTPLNCGKPIINVPETRVVWVNMYPPANMLDYSTRQSADNGAGAHREACVRVPYTVGQFDEEES